MKRIPPLATACTLLLASLLGSASLEAQVIFPVRVNSSVIDNPPYDSVGVFLAGPFRGSASVARSPKLLYTCAHVVYDEGMWLTELEFARGWNAATPPTVDQTVPVRGYRFYSNYSGGNTLHAFALDFAIAYGTADTSFGPALNVLKDGGVALRSATTPKLVLGYPAEIDYTFEFGYYYMHRTGPFKLGMERRRNSFHTVTGASTGPGNSGGPVLISQSGEYYLAGILVSGARTLMGVHGLNDSANKMATNTLAYLASGDSETIRTAENDQTALLPDATRAYSTRTLPIYYLPPTLTEAKLTLRVNSTYSGDLDIYVRSPAGRIKWITKHSLAQNTVDVVLEDVDYSATFAGANPNGDWKVYMRDYYVGDRARFVNAALTVTAE